MSVAIFGILVSYEQGTTAYWIPQMCQLANAVDALSKNAALQ
jgi:hypothetical protein